MTIGPDTAPDSERSIVPGISRSAASADLLLVAVVMALLWAYVEPLLAGSFLWRNDLATSRLLTMALSGGFLLAIINVLLRTRHVTWASLGFFARRPNREIAWAVLVALTALVLGFLWLLVLVKLERWGATAVAWRQETAQWQGHELRSSDVGATIAMFAVGALIEEAVFRGFVLTRLRRIGLPWFLAIGGNALVFGLTHLELGFTYASSAGVLGIVLGAAYKWTRSLFCVIAAHFLYNCAILLLVPPLISLIWG
jgi:membrane protease YdiL (CAAX protease family)